MTIRYIARLATGAMVLAAALTFAACGGALVPGGAPQQSGVQTAQQSIGHFGPYDVWRQSLTRTPFPSSGCFKASFPSTAWVRVPCSIPPNIWFPEPPRHTVHPDSVGDGFDFTADVAPNVISKSVGAFPTVIGVTQVKSIANPLFGGGGALGKNSYSLQLNSNHFTTTGCGGLKDCLGWEQFVFENPPKSSQSYLYIQYWLLHNGAAFTHCPRKYRWTLVDGDCVINSPQSAALPNQSIANLANLSETGNADLSGDSIYLSTGKDMYGTKVSGAGITDLANGWSGAEFNVFGDGGGSIAKFNAGSTLTVSVETDTGVTTAPTCPADTGTTGESNSLTFVAAPGHPSELKSPSILFTESNQRGGTASCDALKGSGR